MGVPSPSFLLHHPPSSPSKIMSAGNMSIRTSLKRAARDFFDSDDTFMDMDALSEDVSEDDSVASYQDQIMATDYNDRMLSPKSAMDMPIMLGASPTKKSRDDSHLEKRVTIWNWREQRKLSGNSAPFKKNLQEYLRKHPDWEEYVGQDKDVNGKKLSPKKMKPPAPMNPDHPALRENYSPP